MTRTTAPEAEVTARRAVGTFPLAALATAAAMALGLSACGGGGSETGGTGATTSGVSTYSGTVTGLGSIVVNGVRFSTSGAETADGDDPSKPFTKAFGLGTTVTVTGTVDDSTGTGTATSIVVHGGVRGLVTAVGSNTFTVGGQVVTVDNSTVYDGASDGFGFASIVANTSYVEVYGVLDASTGVLSATRVEEKDSTVVAAEGFAVRGLVSNLDATARTFDLTIRTGVVARVSYADANVKPTGTTLANALGARVILNATDAAALASATSGTVNVTAAKVIVKREKQNDGVRTAMVGAIKTISSDRKTWTIGDATIDVSQSPELHGVDLSTVAVGTVVKVKGTFANGVLVAKEVSSKSWDDGQTGLVKLYGMVSGSTAATESTPATFVVQGVKVTIATGSSLSLPANGAYVEVKAHAIDGVLTADEIEAHGASSGASRSFELYGTALCTNGQSDLATSFTLAVRNGSVTVNASTATFDLSKNVTLTASDTSKACLLEVTGTMNTVNGAQVLNASKVEVKARGADSGISLR